ncbi:aromatic amino acid lyase [Nakamurella endophytica]|uniref:Histidine ammonia-lyase n=1 Tax=Nakamurella endophytica TaxID=1748367 RepID=A0A917WH48_9ACTN|nr:aromatic amino acid lyase [Nakamurella endophytica]GGM03614.1 histidine ammonia-lyase [Nakamurella endophytica]
MPTPPTVEIDGAPLPVATIAAAAAGPVLVRLTARARSAAQASSALGDREAGRRELYGRSTGVGANRSVGVTGDPAGHAAALVRSHATAAGPLRSRERVRAMLLVRLNQLAAGGSGVRPAVLDGVAALLDGDDLPEVREWGSVGTGDLSALAAAAGALISGRGAPGRPGHRAPVPFGAADALGFLSSNAATLGDAALALVAAGESAAAAPAVAVLTLAAVGGNLEAFSPAVERATPFPGAVAVCRTVRALAAGAAAPARIQDPFALRTLPQVHGPFLDALQLAGLVVERMSCAPAENPVLIAGGSADEAGGVAHHGAFHAAYLSTALSAVTLTAAQSARSSQARLALLCEPAFTGLPPFLSDGTAGASGVMITEYVAASALAEVTAAATPPGLHTAVLSRGVEEDASFASQAARQVAAADAGYRGVLACELVAAVRALRAGAGTGGSRSGPVGELLRLCADLPDDRRDRDLSPDLATATALLPALAAEAAPHLSSVADRADGARPGD